MKNINIQQIIESSIATKQQIITDKVLMETTAHIANAIVACYKNVVTVGMTGQTGGKMKELTHFLLNVPSSDTPRIQESHIMLGHIICEIVEETLFGTHD